MSAARRPEENGPGEDSRPALAEDRRAPSPYPPYGSFSLPLRGAGGLLFLEAGERRLAVDTGSTASRWTGGALSWGRRFLRSPAPFPEAEREKLSLLVPAPVDGVLGGDVLCLEPLRLDAGSGVAMAGGSAMGGSGILLRATFPLGVPLLDVRVEGRHTPLLLDTGAVRSYLPPTRLVGRPLSGVAEDFDRCAGPVQLEVREARVTFGGAEVALPFSLPPPSLRASLPFGGRVGILGTEIFRTFPVVALDYAGGTVLLSRG